MQTINGPDLNPIEEAFAKVKHFLRLNEVVLKSLADPTPVIEIIKE